MVYAIIHHILKIIKMVNLQTIYLYIFHYLFFDSLEFLTIQVSDHMLQLMCDFQLHVQLLIYPHLSNHQHTI